MADFSKYEAFLRETLVPDLERHSSQRDMLLTDIQDLCHTRSQVQLLEGHSSMKTMMNVGCDFYMQASIPDTSKLLITIDPKAGLSVQMSFKEATAFLDKGEAMQQRKVNRLSDKIADIRSHIVTVQQALDQLKLLAQTEPNTPA